MSTSLPRTAILALLAALALAGCGGSEDAPTTRPVEADPPAAENPTGEPPADGEIGVVDLRGEIGVEPERIDFASDASMVGLRWTDWGEEEATGTGGLSLLLCDPNCAKGGSETSPAEMTLSAPVECDGARYYSEAVVEPMRSDLEAPAVYIEPPC